MTSAASMTFAHRLGRTVGLAVRFCLHDRNPKVRWTKRALFAAAATAFLATSFTWFVSSILSLICVALFFFALSQVKSSEVLEGLSHHPNIPRNGPSGYGYYDGYGNYKGSLHPEDDK